jgi:hypothetical protein
MASPARKSRLKVFCTQIGFHSWVVAASSQKAALEAWDVKENLFAIGAAKIVTDPIAVQLALTTPGKAVALDAKHSLAKATRVVSLADHRRTPAKSPPAKAVAKRKKPADRTRLDRAEDALDTFHQRAVRERAGMLRQQRALDRKAEELEEELDAEEESLTDAVDAARQAYESGAT